MAYRQYGQDRTLFMNREQSLFLPHASYEFYHKLFVFMVGEKKYQENKYYHNVTEEMHMKLYEICAQMRNICDLMCNIGNRFGEYRNSSVRQKLIDDSPIRYGHRDTDTVIASTEWNHTSDSNCSITVKKYQTHPIIESALSLLCNRLRIHLTFFNENDLYEKKGIYVINVAIETFERGLQMLQDMHQKNGVTIGNYVSPKYQRHDDIVAEMIRLNCYPYIYNAYRNVYTNNIVQSESQIQIIDSSSPQYEIEIDLNIPITPQTEKKYRVFVTSIIDSRFCLFEKHFPLPEIDNMVNCDMMCVTLMFFNDKKYCSQKILIEKKIYQDIVSTLNGKYDVVGVDHVKYDGKTFDIEKRLVDGHLYSQALSPRWTDVETEITIYNYVTIDGDVIVNRKASANKITSNAMMSNNSMMRIYPTLTKLSGVRFRLDDVVISRDVLSSIERDLHSCIKIKPIITSKNGSVYYEYALVPYPLDDRLVNVNVYDPKRNIKKNVILDETTYFRICGKYHM